MDIAIFHNYSIIIDTALGHSLNLSIYPFSSSVFR